MSYSLDYNTGIYLYVRSWAYIYIPVLVNPTSRLALRDDIFFTWQRAVSSPNDLENYDMYIEHASTGKKIGNFP